MLDVVILETAQHVHDGIDLANVAEKLVAQAFALRGTAHQTCNVDERKLGGDDLLAARDGGQLVEPRIGHCDIADIGLDRAERIVRRLRRLRLGQRVEQRGLADIRQPDDTAFETHDYPSLKVIVGACADPGCALAPLPGQFQSLRSTDIMHRLDPGAIGGAAQHLHLHPG